MIETLRNLQPAMIIVLIAAFLTLETLVPYVTHYRNRKKHTIRNLILVSINFVVNGLIGSWMVAWLSTTQKLGWGLLNMVHLAPWVSAIAGVILIDLDSYVGHILFHKVSWLWRIHQVHHSDDELDSTSALRFHPLESVAQAVWRTASFGLLGIPLPSFVLFLTFLLPVLFLQHANVRVPRWLESSLGAAVVLSSWHKIHHSDEQRFTDSHYGNLLTFWDRLFGTAHRGVNVEELRWGLEEFRADEDQTVSSQLMLPFKNKQRAVREGISVHMRNFV